MVYSQHMHNCTLNNPVQSEFYTFGLVQKLYTTLCIINGEPHPWEIWGWWRGFVKLEQGIAGDK